MEKKSVGYIEGNLKIRYKYPLGDHVVEAIFLSLFTLGLWYGVYFLSGQLPDLLLDKLFPDVMPGGEQLLFSILLWIALLVILLIPLAMMRLLYKLVCKLVNTWHLEAEGNLFILSAGPLPWLGQNNKFALADISRFENRVLIGGGGG